MNVQRLTLLLATGAALAAPGVASADTLVTAAPDAANLAAGGGYLAWAAPAPEGGFQLTVRKPDGTVSVPAIKRFGAAPDPAIGSDRQLGTDRAIVAVYSRDGDIYSLNLQTGAERKVAGAASQAYEETAPSIQYGRLTFVRRGGSNNGLFYKSEKGLKRITTARPRETAMNGSRVAYPSGRSVVIRRLSGRGSVATLRTPSPAFSLVLDRYALTWAVSGGRLLQTNRFGGSSDVEAASRARAASQRLPATTNSIALSGAFVRYYADAEGIKRLSAQNLFR